MKYFVNLFVVTLLVLISTHTFAEQKIVVLDMKQVLNLSKAGKGAQDFLKKSFNDNQKKFSNLEKALKKEENDLLEKKTIISKEEYTKKANTLRKKVIDYQSDRRTSLEKITAQRSESRTKLLKKVEPILSAYIKENDISLVIDKKNLLGGRPELNITEEIIKRLNKELPSLDLK